MEAYYTHGGAFCADLGSKVGLQLALPGIVGDVGAVQLVALTPVAVTDLPLPNCTAPEVLLELKRWYKENICERKIR